MMIEPGTPPSVRVRAAEAIFNHAAKAIEIEDIDARVAALEADTYSYVSSEARVRADHCLSPLVKSRVCRPFGPWGA
jgi:hypothetical protein